MMQKSGFTLLALAAVVGLAVSADPADGGGAGGVGGGGGAGSTSVLTMKKIGGFKDDREGDDASDYQIIAAKLSAKLLFVTEDRGVDVFRWNDNGAIELITSTMVDLPEGSSPTSIAYSDVHDTLAVTVAPDDLLEKGTLYIIPDIERWEKCNFCTYDVEVLETGFHPDMVTIALDGSRIVVANEGEPSDYAIEGADPVGSVSIYTYTSDPSLSYGWEFSDPCYADFAAYDDQLAELKSRGVRITGVNGTTVSEDMEPEHVALSSDNKWAYVTLQENNAIAKVDIEKCVVDSIIPLGYKNWGEGLTFDASDKDDSVNLQSWDILGMFMPDNIVSFDINGKTYYATTNEGDDRDIETNEEGAEDYSDGTRLEDIVEALTGEDAAPPFTDLGLGRLMVSNVFPYEAENGLDSKFYSFGCRSLSVYDEDASMLWESGDFIETYTADEKNGFVDFFNSQGTVESKDKRSDNQGPEPEGLTVGKVQGRTFLFVGLERIGGWMCFDATDPEKPAFQSYTNPISEDGLSVQDIQPESSVFIPEEYGANGHALLIAAYSKSIAVFQISLGDDGGDDGVAGVERLGDNGGGGGGGGGYVDAHDDDGVAGDDDDADGESEDSGDHEHV